MNKMFQTFHFEETDLYDRDGDGVNKTGNNMAEDPESDFGHNLLCCFFSSKPHNNIIFAPGLPYELIMNLLTMFTI